MQFEARFDQSFCGEIERGAHSGHKMLRRLKESGKKMGELVTWE
jgi:hypothetical protein